MGIPPRDVNAARARVQAQLDEWQMTLGRNAATEESQKSRDTAKRYATVEELLRRLEEDLGE